MIASRYEVLEAATRREICEKVQNPLCRGIQGYTGVPHVREVKKPSSTQKMQRTPLQTLKKRLKCAKYDCLAVRGPGSGYKATKTRKGPKSPQIRTLALCALWRSIEVAEVKKSSSTHKT